MALIKSDRVKETSTSETTANFILGGAATGYRAFSSVCAIGDTFYYAISHQTLNQWECGLGTYGAGNVLERTTVHASSNSGAKVNFSAGTKECFLTLTARHLDRIQDNGQSTAIGGKTSVVAVNDSATLPDLDLQFADLKTLTAKYGPTPSYSRASAGTFFNASGVLTSAAVNEPRFDHVFENGAWVSKGLLIEEQRTNIWLQSKSLNTSPWAQANNTTTESAAPSPDGSSSAASVVPNTTNAAHYTYQVITNSAIAYSVSFYAKANGYNFIQLSSGLTNDYVNFNLSTGTVGNKSQSENRITSQQIQSIGNGWYRCSAIISAIGSTHDYGIAVINADTASRRPAFAGDGTSGVLLYGFQMEAGSFSTSHIPTTTTSVIRSADVCQITGSAFTNLWNTTEGTISLEQDLLSYSDPAADQRYFAVAGGSNNPGLTLHYDGGSSFYWERYFNSASNLTLSDISAAYKVAIAFKTNDYATTLNGATPVTATSPAFGTNFAKMDIGYQVGATARSSWIQRLRYFRSRLDNTQLVNLSGGINTLAFKTVTGSGSVTVANEYTDINISVPNPLPIANGGTNATTQLAAVTNLVGNPPNDGGQYTLASKKTSGTPTFYWVDGTGYAPTLDLLFAADKSLTAYKGPTPTFSRASTGTFFNSSGVLTSAAINTPRFDHTYNGTSWVSRGLLVEEQRTNICLFSEQFNDSSYAKNNCTVTANAIASPDGQTTADTLTATSSTAIHYLEKTGYSVSTVQNTISIFAKYGTHRYLQLSANNEGSGIYANFDLVSGVVGSVGASTTSQITNVGGGWYRCSMTYTATNTASRPLVVLVSSSTAARVESNTLTSGDYLYLWGCQQETGAFPTSYIPTTSASVTRSADVCQITGTDFSGFWNGTEGSVVAEYDRLAPIGTATPGYTYPRTFSFAGTSGNNVALFGRHDSSPPQELVSASASSVQQFAFSPNTTDNTALGVQKIALAFKTDDSALSYKGTAVLTDNLCTVPVVTSLSIGSLSGSSNYLSGHISRLRYYPVRLPNATLQVLST